LTDHARSPQERYDFLVLGSGLAALTFALEVGEHGTVCLLTKRGLSDSNTDLAQGGMASAVGQGDSVGAHVADTLATGAGLSDPQVVRMVVEDGPEITRRLVAWGVPFERAADGEEWDLGREGGHSARRVLHAGDFTGRAIRQSLEAQVRRHPNVEVFEDMMAVDLITAWRLGMKGAQDRCFGAYVIDKRKRTVVTVQARVTLLATGGAGKVYLYTTNPDVATGDGVAMAWRAGCRVANMEFFQFHPTCLYHPTDRSFLISEALRGEGGVLRNQRLEPFMERYSPMKDLAPRDVVARSIDAELKRTGDDHVLLDMTGLDPAFVRGRFPNIHARLSTLGLDMTAQPIPVVPAAHYMCGGVVVDAGARTGIEGLLAAGEVACTGLHGANRLASNSLLEAASFGLRAARTAVTHVRERRAALNRRLPAWNARFTVESDEAVVVSQNWDEIRRFMWNYVGVVRSNNRLLRAKKRILLLREEIRADYWRYYPWQDLVELRNLAQVAELIIDSALARHESRGLHFNVDFPERDDRRFERDTVLWRGRAR
jgi:L-aspartate oxidase